MQELGARVSRPAPEVEHLLRCRAPLTQSACKPVDARLREILPRLTGQRQPHIERAVVTSRILIEGRLHYRRRMFNKLRNRHERIVWYPNTASVTPGTTTRIVSA